MRTRHLTALALATGLAVLTPALAGAGGGGSAAPQSATPADPGDPGTPPTRPTTPGKGPKGDDPVDPPPPCEVVLVCGDDLAAALELEAKAADHLWYGHMLEIDYGTPERIAGDVSSIGAWGDSGLWTGVYLAGQSHRYALARHHLDADGLDAEDAAFWSAQKDEAKARIDRIVGQYHLTVNIAREWQTEFDPQVNPEGPAFTYGGGVYQGREGMLMRSCAPDDAPAGRHMGLNKRVFGPFTWTYGDGDTTAAHLRVPEGPYRCETAPSRDTYAGTTFGLVTALDLVGPDDPELRELIGRDLMTLGDFLVDNAWNYPRPHGNLKIPVGQQRLPDGTPVPMTDHDFDGVLSPLFVYVPSARLNMTAVARHAARIVGTTEENLRWDAVWAEEWATQGPVLAGSMEVDALEPNNGYYKYNLNHLTMFNLSRLVTEPVLRDEVLRAFGVMDHTTGDDMNAHFETLTHAVTGELPRFDAAVEHLRMWRGYRARIETGVAVDNASRCGTEIECVPEDQLDMVFTLPTGETTVVTKPGTATRLRARRALPPDLRTPTDFLWQRPPTQLNGQEGATHEAPGIDYLTPYWILRYYSEVGTPFASPFPAWPGPAHE